MSALNEDCGPPSRAPRGGLRRLALPGLADHHHRIDIDRGKGRDHGGERGAAAIHAVATADPVEGGESRALAHPAQGIDELGICGGAADAPPSGNPLRRARSRLREG